MAAPCTSVAHLTIAGTITTCTICRRYRCPHLRSSGWIRFTLLQMYRRAPRRQFELYCRCDHDIGVGAHAVHDAPVLREAHRHLSLRVGALGSKIPLDSRISSVTLDRAKFIASGAMVSLVGTMVAPLLLPLTHALRLYAFLFAASLFCLLVLVVLAMLNRWPLVSRSSAQSRRWP